MEMLVFFRTPESPFGRLHFQVVSRRRQATFRHHPSKLTQETRRTQATTTTSMPTHSAPPDAKNPPKIVTNPVGHICEGEEQEPMQTHSLASVTSTLEEMHGCDNVLLISQESTIYTSEQGDDMIARFCRAVLKRLRIRLNYHSANATSRQHPLSALGLAGNIVAFVDLAWTILTEARTVYKSICKAKTFSAALGPRANFENS